MLVLSQNIDIRDCAKECCGRRSPSRGRLCAGDVMQTPYPRRPREGGPGSRHAGRRDGGASCLLVVLTSSQNQAVKTEPFSKVLCDRKTS